MILEYSTQRHSQENEDSELLLEHTRTITMEYWTKVVKIKLPYNTQNHHLKTIPKWYTGGSQGFPSP